LDGGVEIETSLGEIRKFQTGGILLVEDISGKGHKTKNLEKKERTSVFYIYKLEIKSTLETEALRKFKINPSKNSHCSKRDINFESKDEY
jgi:hypothetical protein